MKKRTFFSCLIYMVFCLSVFSQTYFSGGLASGTWSVANSPYIITGSVTVDTAATLIIEAGVKVLFNGNYAFTVKGTLLAEGSETDTIVFTSPDTIAYWQGLRFSNTNLFDSSRISYAIIEKGRASDGGGMSLINSSNILVEHTIIRNNRATRNGGGIYLNNSSPSFSNCEIAYNICDRYSSYYYGGGGMHLAGSSGIKMFRTVIHHNSSDFGGAIHLKSTGLVDLDHCTIANNYLISYSYYYGGIYIYAYYKYKLSISNSIFWGNQGNYMYFYGTQSGSMNVSYSDFQGGQTGEGNLNITPGFVNTGIGDFNLISSSPCIDAGDPGSLADPDGTRADMGALPTDRSNELNAWFRADTNADFAPLTVHFRDLSNGGGEAIQSWLWDFGDGTTSLEQNPVKTFNDPGNYDISLIIYTSTTSDTVVVPSFVRSWPAGFIQAGEVYGVWEKTKSPYLIAGDIILPKDKELIIEAGVKVVFEGHYEFTINGRLFARGAAADSILFVPADSTEGWKGLRFDHIDDNGQDTCILDYCKVEYGKTISTQSSPYYNGAGIHCQYSTRLRISNSVIAHNSAYYYGGGICFYTYSSANIYNTEIRDNTARYGGGIAFYSNARTSILKNVIISNNRATSNGGGIYWSSSSTRNHFDRVQISGNLAIYGGGIYCSYNTGSTLNRMTISGNRATSRGGAVFGYTFYCSNTIMWNNTPQEISNTSSGPPVIYANYSDINYSVSGTGNIRSNPLFVDPAAGDYELQAASPCIDAGNIDDPYDPDGSVRDIGMYYYHQDILPFRALFIADDLDKQIPSEVSFQDISTNGYGVNTSWKWHFGDGDSSDVQNPVHTYEDIGLYTVKLIITDSRGMTDTLIRTNYIRAHGTEGTISGSWSAEDSPINVTGHIVVPEGEHLIIEPDVDVIFWGSYYMTVYGRLTATGLNGNPNEFTAKDTTGFYNGTNTTWGGLKFMNTGQDGQDSSVLEYCRFWYSSSAVSFSNSSNIKLDNCIMVHNRGGEGAGIYISNSSPLIENTNISYNHAYSAGGGVSCQSGSAPLFRNVYIGENTSDDIAGGMRVYRGNPVFEGVYVTGNHAVRGGGMEIYNRDEFNGTGLEVRYNHAELGGGIFISGSDGAPLRNLYLRENSADFGGGIYVDNDRTLVQAQLVENRADSLGGGIYVKEDWLNLLNSTVYGNICDNPGGGLYKESGTVKVNSCIFWENTNDDIASSDGNVDVDFSNMQVEWPGDGNIHDNPMFADEDDQDFNLLWDSYPLNSIEMSPCIDAGDPLLPIDPDGSRTDMGALPFEQQDLKPKILSILDVPNDQGKAVQVVWKRSEYDIRHGYDPILKYSLWRFDRDPEDSLKSIKTFINELPARQEEKYSMHASTLYDSVDSGTQFTSFEVLAHTGDVWRFFISEPDSGYSIDNIAPMVPLNTLGMAESNGVTLMWSPPTEEDYAFTSVFRDDSLVVQTIDTVFNDPGLKSGTNYIYDIRHFDINGNESPSESVEVLTMEWTIGIVANMAEESSTLMIGTHEYGTEGLDESLDLTTLSGTSTNYLLACTHHPDWAYERGDYFRQDVMENIELGSQFLSWEVNILSPQSGETSVNFEFSTGLPDIPVVFRDEQTGERKLVSEDSTYRFTLLENTPYKLMLFVGDTVAPGISILDPGGLKIMRSDEPSEVNWQLEGAGPGDITQVSISYDGGLNYEFLGSTGQSSMSIFPAHQLSNDCRIRAIVTDQSGNQSTAYSDYWFTVVDSILPCELNAGWHLWSSQEIFNGPLSDQLMDELNGTAYIYSWDGESYSQENNLKGGDGVWLGLVNNETFNIVGEPVVQDFSKMYPRGWNIISNPYVRAIDVDSLIIMKGGATYTFGEAVSMGIISGNVYSFADNQYAVSRNMDLWEAFWIGILSEDVSIHYKLHRRTVEKAALAMDGFLWEVRINGISAGGKMESEMLMDEFDRPMPPSPPGGLRAGDYLDICFTHPEWNFILGERFMNDIRPVNTWDLIQEYPLKLSGSGDFKLNYSIIGLPATVDIQLEINSEKYDMRAENEITVSIDGFLEGTLRIGENLVSIEGQDASDRWIIYPNPVAETIWIQPAKGTRGDLLIEIVDVMGRIVKFQQIHDVDNSEPSGVNVSGLEEGFYQIIIKHSSGLRKMTFIKE